MNDIKIKKYHYIDAIRGLAILGVIFVHTAQWISPSSDFLTTMAKYGARGVQLFFMASALTLFLSMASREGKENHSTFQFFIRRFFRIAPAFYIAIIIYTLYNGSTESYWAPNGIEWWYAPLTALFLHGWHAETFNSVVPGGWSIAVEMTFYLFVPYLFSQLSTIKRTIITLIISIIIAKVTSKIIIYFVSAYYPETQQYLARPMAFMSIFSQMPIFLLGILTYHLINRFSTIKKTTAQLLLALSIFLFIGFFTQNISGKYLYFGLAFMLLIFSLHHYPSRLIVNPITIFLGKISFSLYLAHFIVISLLENNINIKIYLEGDTGFIIGVLIILGFSSIISYITYHYVEKTGMKLGSQLSKKFSRSDRITYKRMIN